MARMSMVLCMVQPNGHITGNTERITTSVSAGWCGVDIVERVKFDLNTAGALLIDVEGMKYKLRGIKKHCLHEALRTFCTGTKAEMEKHAIK
jgi:hypothetical protein